MSLYQQGVTLKALLENPNLVNPPKKRDATKEEKLAGSIPNEYSGQSAFLGPQLWDKTLPFIETDNEFALEYLDLDEFLQENGIGDEAQNQAMPPLSPQLSQSSQQSPQPHVNNPQAFLPQLHGQGLSPLHISPPQSPHHHHQQHPLQTSPMMGLPTSSPIKPHSPQTPTCHRNLQPDFNLKPAFTLKPEFVASPPPCSQKEPQLLQTQPEPQPKPQPKKTPLPPSPSPQQPPGKASGATSIDHVITPHEEDADETCDSLKQELDDEDLEDIDDASSELGTLRGASRKFKSPLKTESCEVNEHELAFSTVPGGENFDPRKRAFSEDELRPQPMIKKSKKIFVPEERKDVKYWARRQKNNVAAKRSRDARRIKENQIAMRAAFLEKQSSTLEEQVQQLIEENLELKKRLEKYEKVDA